MSSSSRFLLGLLAAVPLYALIAGASLLLDARALVAPSFPDWPRLCGPGIRDDRRHAIPHLALARQPREILLGTSRVFFGFSQEDAEELLEAPVVNLALDGASFPEMDRLVRAAWAQAPVKRLWIGLDYYMFVMQGRQPAGAPLPLAPKTAALVHGAAPATLVDEVAQSVRDGKWCSEPGSRPSGFRNSSGPRAVPTRRQLARQEASLKRDFRAATATGMGALRSRRREEQEQLGRLLRDSSQRGIEIVLFLAPTHDSNRLIEGDPHLAADNRAWLADIMALSRQYPGVRLLVIPKDDPIFAGQPASCSSRMAENCAFSDLTHYRTWVGRRILERGTRPVSDATAR